MRERPNQQSFRHARHTFDQSVIARENHDQRFLDDGVLANDYFPDLLPCVGERLLQSIRVYLHKLRSIKKAAEDCRTPKPSEFRAM